MPGLSPNMSTQLLEFRYPDDYSLTRFWDYTIVKKIAIAFWKIVEWNSFGNFYTISFSIGYCNVKECCLSLTMEWFLKSMCVLFCLLSLNVFAETELKTIDVDKFIDKNQCHKEIKNLLSDWNASTDKWRAILASEGTLLILFPSLLVSYYPYRINNKRAWIRIFFYR